MNSIKTEYRTFTFNQDTVDISVKYRIQNEDLIFFIHGLGCGKNHFDEVWNYDILDQYSIVTFDLPGCGDSSRPTNFSYDLQEHAKICLKLLSFFPEQRIHIVGHSMGGAIGLILAELIPQTVQSFINVEGNLMNFDCEMSRRKASVPFIDFVARELPGLQVVTELSDEPGTRLWSKNIRRADKKGFYCSSRSLVSWSDSGVLLDKFKKLNCNKVYVYGENNSFLRILTSLDGIQKTCISKSGHFPMNDNPGEFYEFIADFIG